jgi:hypothetical protein
MVLVEYDDVLDPVQAYSVLALAALWNKSYGACSKAFIKLESLKTLTEPQQKLYESLALEIFSRHRPSKGDADASAVEWPVICCLIPQLLSRTLRISRYHDTPGASRGRSGAA